MIHKVTWMVRRKTPVPPDRQPCFICDKYASLCHGHHVMGCREVAEYCASYEDIRGLPLTLPSDVPVVFLCPTHHALWHRLSDAHGPELHASSLLDLTPDEDNRYAQLDRLYRSFKEELIARLEQALRAYKEELANA